MISKDDYLTNQRIFAEHFESWRKAWADQDVDAYIKYYDTTFRTEQMDYWHWYRHKEKLKKIYKYIKVDLEKPLILANGGQVVLRTMQHYESDLHQDTGEKTIHANASAENGFLIVREDWKPLRESPPQIAGDKKPVSASNEN
jgi:hypothetical protein